MKVRESSITWYEAGRLARFNRQQSGRNLLVSALGAAGIGFLLALAMIWWGSLSAKDAVVLISVSTLAPFFLVGVWGLFGLSVAITNTHLIRVAVGSKSPHRINYQEIRNCRVDSRVLDGQEFKVLQVFLTSGKKVEVELQDGSDADAISAFLAKRGVAVDVSA